MSNIIYLRFLSNGFKIFLIKQIFWFLVILIDIIIWLIKYFMIIWFVFTLLKFIIMLCIILNFFTIIVIIVVRRIIILAKYSFTDRTFFILIRGKRIIKNSFILWRMNLFILIRGVWIIKILFTLKIQIFLIILIIILRLLFRVKLYLRLLRTVSNWILLNFNHFSFNNILRRFGRLLLNFLRDFYRNTLIFLCLIDHLTNFFIWNFHKFVEICSILWPLRMNIQNIIYYLN
jgi:hypothetical protein